MLVDFSHVILVPISLEYEARDHFQLFVLVTKNKKTLIYRERGTFIETRLVLKAYHPFVFEKRIPCWSTFHM